MGPALEAPRLGGSPMTKRCAAPYLCLLATACGADPPRTSVAADAQRLSVTCDTTPTGVETTDYALHFNVPPGLMPDPQLAGRPAKISVHRIRPLYANGKCPTVPARAAVLVHGRTTPAETSFDYRSGPDRTGEYSYQ